MQSGKKLALGLVFLTGCTVDTNQIGIPTEESNESSDQEETLRTEPVAYRVEAVAQDLFVPWGIVFTSETRMLFTERNGRVREFNLETMSINPEPLKVFNEVSTQAEEGLMGIALDPNYSQNRYIYTALAYPSGQGLQVKIVRLTDDESTLTDEQVVFGGIPAARFHAGGRIRFGPDGKLYIATGDALEAQLAQNLSVLHGKILRVNSDGAIPEDNPFPNSPVWSLGHRNPQGIDWHPEDGAMYSTEHGPSGFDGPGGGDEVNLITAGSNYGWPDVSHQETDPRFTDPKLVFTPAVAPASGEFIDSNTFPQFRHNFFFGGLVGEGLFRVIVNSNDPTVVEGHEKLPDVNVGRVRAVAEGPDGYIYFSTSNRDGRGDLQAGDDKIYRLVPA